MSKPSAPRLVAANEAIASLRDVKTSTGKAQLVLDLIRGKPVERAINDLTFCRKKMAGITKKLLLSAVANAENNHQLNVDQLVVARAFADRATVLKRWNPRARGRAAPILKARSHITIIVAEKAPVAKTAAKPVKAEKAAAKTETATEQTEA